MMERMVSRSTMEEMEDKKEGGFFVGDFEKAHRRFKYKRTEQGYLGCQVVTGEDCVYVNKVGTFGVGED